MVRAHCSICLTQHTAALPTLGTVRRVHHDNDQSWGPNWPGTPTAATVPTTAAAGSSSVAAEGKEGEKGSNKGKVDEGKPAEAPKEGAPWDPEYGFDGGGDAVGDEGHGGEGSDERPRKVIKITCSFEIHLE